MVTQLAPLLSLQGISLTFGGAPLLRDVEMHVHPQDRLCLVGRNGSGKSTLLKIAAGVLEADRGERKIRQGVTLRYLEQEPDFSGFATVRDYALAGLGPGGDAHRIDWLCSDLLIAPEADPSALSGGEARRAALVRAMAPAPDLLMMDEPTNHLDLPAIEWLEAELSRSRSALVLISHDRRFLEKLTKRTLWLDRGRVRSLDSGFSAFEAWRDAVLEQEERERHKLDRKIAAEEDWMRYGVTARRKRNVRRVRELQELRSLKRSARGAAGNVTITTGDNATSSKKVIEAKSISKAFGDRQIVRDFSLLMQRGDKLGIAGPNGAGKTTLVKLLTGQMAPDSGSVRLGTKLEIVSLDQRRADLEPTRSLAETLTDGRGDQVFVAGQPRHVMSYLQDFLFQPEQAGTPVGRLSGGERGRLGLAVAFAQPSNLLVLDEPTNDLDLETLELLEEAVADYAGTVILISHDRDFLDRTVTSMLTPDPARPDRGYWLEYVGGYSDMLAQRGAVPREATKAEKPAQKAKPAREPGRKLETPPARARLSNKEQQALKTLPDQIAKLESAVATLRSRIAEPAFYQKDKATIEESLAKLAKAEEALAAAEEEWLRLEMLREEMEAG